MHAWRSLVTATAQLSFVVAAAALVALCALVLLSITTRIMGSYIGGIDSLAGYAMAVCGFTGLAYAMHQNEHIRVNLFVQLSSGRTRKVTEVIVTGVAAVLVGYFAWYGVRLTWLSWYVGDVSPYGDRTPLWIPQSALSLGAVMLLVTVLDRFLSSIADLRGGLTDDRDNAGETLPRE